MSTTHTSHRWTDLPVDTPMPLLERRRVIGTQCMVSHVTLRKGCFVPLHSHENEQIVCVLSGCLRLTVAGSVVRVRAGEVLLVPPLVEHDATAEEDSVALDVFAPPSAMTGVDRR